MKDKINDVFVSTDKRKLDIDLIYNFITNSYWGKGRTLELIRKAIDNSFCFGLFKEDEQIGFARVITDSIFFAYLMDVFIIERYRGNGYSKILLDEVFRYQDFAKIKKWLLATRDGHDLYKQFQFKGIQNPEKFMERIKA